MIVVAGTLRIRPECWDEARQQVAVAVAATRPEPGCISYRIFEAGLAPHTCFIFEEWESAEALQAHFQTSHFATLGTFLKEAAAEPAELQRYEVTEVGPLSAEE